jgi:hypothetical protein
VALVEFAILLPFLSILVFGTIDVGRALVAWNEAKGAAGAAADYASTAPYRQQDDGDQCADPDNAAFRGQAEGGNEFAFVFRPALDCYVGVDARTDDRFDDELKVTAVRDFTLFTPLVGKAVGPVRIEASVTVRTSL